MAFYAKIGAAIVLSLSTIAMTGAVPVARDRNVAIEGRGDLEALLWPSAEASRRYDHRGERLAAAALRDRIVVVSFVRADCTIVCAVRTLGLDKLAGALPKSLRDRVVVLCIDTGPASADADGLRVFADGLVGGSSRLRFVAGDPDLTAALLAKLRYPAMTPSEPPSTVLVFDRRGQVAMTYGSDPLDGERLLRDVALLDTFADGIGRPAHGAGPDASAPF